MDIKVLIGQTLVSVVNNENDELLFVTDSGKKYRLWHIQGCFEAFQIEDICGDLKDLIGIPIIEAEEISGETPNDYEFDCEPASFTWTFYKIGTRKGSVTIRWLGTSNGCYSESVDFCEVKSWL